MKRCTGGRGCPEWIASDDDACTYHAKIHAGLIVPDPATFQRGWTSRMRPARRQPPTISPADVVSDEQRELVGLMRNMGASDAKIREVLARKGRRR